MGNKSVLLICSLFFIFSCKKSENINLSRKIVDYQANKKSIKFTIDFPDTLYVDQIKNGDIHYKSPLDTIIPTFGNKDKNRYTRFILTTTDSVNYDCVYP